MPVVGVPLRASLPWPFEFVSAPEPMTQGTATRLCAR